MADTFALLLACGRTMTGRGTAAGAAFRVEAESGVDAALRIEAARVQDWDFFVADAERHGILPIVCRALLDLNGETLGTVARDRLVRARRESAARALAATRQLADVLTTLADAGVPGLPFKGPALALDAYGDPFLRECDDLDTAVAPDDLPRAERALRAVGYAPQDGQSWRDARATNDWQGHVALVRIAAPDAPLPVELHWRFCDRKLPWTLDVRGVLTRATPRTIAGAAIPVPDATDQLVLVLLHAARHGWDRLESVVCAASLVARGVDGDAVLARAREAGGVRACLVGLLLAQELFGTPVPESLLHEASAMRRPLDLLVVEAMHRLRAGDAGDARDARLHMASLDSRSTQLRYLALGALLPTPRDRRVVTLPRALAALYVPIRLARLTARALAGGKS